MLITPNRLTVLRIALAFVSPALLLWNRSMAVEIAVFFIFTVACISDWFDGHLARKHSMITGFGKIADPVADKLMILGLMFVFVSFELYSFEWIFIICVREVAVTVARLRLLARQQVLPAEWAGKIKVGFQIGSVYATLIYLIAFDSGLFYAKEPIVLFLFQTVHYIAILLAALFTVASGLSFFSRLKVA
jgi:CDP-diacylglycerol---glycerol-3-phosphate 3-phosphatidyltransferase